MQALREFVTEGETLPLGDSVATHQATVEIHGAGGGHDNRQRRARGALGDVFAD